MTTDRRTFLSQAAVSMAAFTVAGDLPPLAKQAPSAAAHTPARTLDTPLLIALGEAVLPSSLGALGRTRAVHAFRDWVAAYVPVSEEMHGYGSAEITYTAADPAPGWNAQLQGLDLLARKQLGAGLAALGAEKRDALVRAQLARVRVDRLPANPLSAQHVAVALLAHWAASSEATDLAYGVHIGKETCRALGDSPRKPLPLAVGGKR
jgi:hypothetical protein